MLFTKLGRDGASRGMVRLSGVSSSFSVLGGVECTELIGESSLGDRDPRALGVDAVLIHTY